MGHGHFRVAGRAAVSLVGATVLMAWILDLPVKDPDSVAGPTYVRLPVILLAAFVIDVLPRAVLASRGRWNTVHQQIAHLARTTWPVRRIKFIAAGLLAWYACYASFRNLKAFAPYANQWHADDFLSGLDRMLWFGYDPASVLQSVFGTTWAAPFFSGVYIVWIGLVPFSLIVALVWWPNRREAAWFITAIAADWALGAFSHIAIPALGPIYTNPGNFAALPRTQVTWMQELLAEERLDYLRDPLGAEALNGVSAFVSLHVGLVVTMVAMAHLLGLPRWLTTTLWTFLVLTFLSTVYFGWHYSVDGIAGALVGLAGVWLGAKATGSPLSRQVDERPGTQQDHQVATPA